MAIRIMAPADIPAIVALWNNSVDAGEVVYKPLTPGDFSQKLIDGIPGGGKAICLVADRKGQVEGFVHGVLQGSYLPGETPENTPVYLTALFVAPAKRRQGVGTALLDAFLKAGREAGKGRAMVSDHNPVQLGWRIPGAPGHDHNKAPGVDEDCMGYGFLQNKGFAVPAHEIAMYLPLAQYAAPTDLAQRQEALAAHGIITGRYDVALRYDFDRMCDRVGSEYWRKVLQDETKSACPRPILAATCDRHIVGFTGPVDLEPSGRGWFTGICTDPEFGGRGIATVLFNLLMQEFIAVGAAFSTLFTGADNHAQRLYLHTGFTVVRRFAVMEKKYNSTMRSEGFQRAIAKPFGRPAGRNSPNVMCGVFRPLRRATRALRSPWTFAVRLSGENGSTILPDTRTTPPRAHTRAQGWAVCAVLAPLIGPQKPGAQYPPAAARCRCSGLGFLVGIPCIYTAGSPDPPGRIPHPGATRWRLCLRPGLVALSGASAPRCLPWMNHEKTVRRRIHR